MTFRQALLLIGLLGAGWLIIQLAPFIFVAGLVAL